jgi:hypothetical protein
MNNMTVGSSIAAFISGMKQDCEAAVLPPDAGLPSVGQGVVNLTLVRNTRHYIEAIVHQINGCYENGWYDACAVMIRRLVETLIIETFEHYGIANQIKNSQNDFVYLADMINVTLKATEWNLSRNAKKALPNLKNIGDRSAHNRRYVAHRKDIDDLKPHLRDIVQELVYLSNLKK